MATKLKYVGDGSFFPGVPADDFVCDDDKQAKELIASGLYKAADEKAKEAK
jgi:hypothetical protein